MEIVSGFITLLFLAALLFTVVGALDPAGDPVGWMQDKISALKSRFR